MSEAKSLLIDEILQNKRIFQMQDLHLYVREPKALDFNFLTKRISLLSSDLANYRFVLDAIIFNDHWVQRMLSPEGIFSTAQGSNDFFKVSPLFGQSIAGYIAKHLPNNLLNSANKFCENPLNFLARHSYPGAKTTLIDLLVTNEHFLNVHAIQQLIVKSNSVVNGELFYSGDFIKLLSRVSFSDLIGKINHYAFKELFYAKPYDDDSVEAFLELYGRNFIEFEQDEITYLTALLDSGLDIQQLGVKSYFCSASQECKKRLLNLITNKFETLEQVSEINFDFLDVASASKSILEQSIILLNNLTALSETQITDDANNKFTNLLHKSIDLIEPSAFDIETEFQYRTDPAALYAVAYAVHRKTRRIFEEVLGNFDKSNQRLEPDV